MTKVTKSARGLTPRGCGCCCARRVYSRASRGAARSKVLPPHPMCSRQRFRFSQSRCARFSDRGSLTLFLLRQLSFISPIIEPGTIKRIRPLQAAEWQKWQKVVLTRVNPAAVAAHAESSRVFPVSLYKIFVYFEAVVHESTILSFAPPTCIAHPGAILLHDYWTVYDSPSDLAFVWYTPYNIGNNNIV